MHRWSFTKHAVGFSKRFLVASASVCFIALVGCGSEEAKTDVASNKTDTEVASVKTQDSPTPSESKTHPVVPVPTAKVASVERAFDLIPADSFAAIVVRPQQIVSAPIFAGAIDQAAKEFEDWKSTFQSETGLTFDSVEAVVVVSWPDLQAAPAPPEPSTLPLEGPKLPPLPGECFDELGEEPKSGDEKPADSTPAGDPTLPPILEEPAGFDEPELPFPAAGGAIVLLSKEITLADLGIGGVNHEANGKTFFVKEELAYSLIDSKTLAISSEDGIQQLLSAKPGSALAKQLAGLDLTAPITLTVNKERAGDLIELFNEPSVAPMIADVSTVTLAIGLSETVNIRVTIDADNAELPTQLQSMAEQGLAEGKSVAKAMLPVVLGQVMGEALAQTATEIALETLDSVKLSANGTRFTVSFVIPKNAGDLLPQLILASSGSSESSDPVLPPTPRGDGPSLPPEPNPFKDLD